MNFTLKIVCMSIVCGISGFVVAADSSSSLKISFLDPYPQISIFYGETFTAKYRFNGNKRYNKRYNKIDMQGTDDVAFFITFIREIYKIPDGIDIGLKLYPARAQIEVLPKI